MIASHLTMRRRMFPIMKPERLQTSGGQQSSLTQKNISKPRAKRCGDPGSDMREVSKPLDDDPGFLLQDYATLPLS